MLFVLTYYIPPKKRSANSRAIRKHERLLRLELPKPAKLSTRETADAKAAEEQSAKRAKTK